MGRFLDKKLKNIDPYTPGEQPKGIENLIKLNTNENPYPPGPSAIESVTRAQVENLRLYPDPTCSGLIDALCERYGVGKDNIIIGNGSDEILAFCFFALCGDGAVYPDITYGFYSALSGLYSVPTDIVPLREDFTIAVEDYAGKTGTLFIANPNAPTGICLPLEKIEELILQNRSRLVIVDEAYVDFGGESAIPLLKKYDNLLIVHTFSKSRQMAGARLAYAVGPADIIADLNAVKYSFNPYSANRIALLVGEASVRDNDYFEKCRKMLIDSREYTVRELKTLGFEILDSKTNFIFAKPTGLSGEAYFKALREKSIIVRYFSAERTKDYVRISIGTQQQMERFVEATKEILYERRA